MQSRQFAAIEQWKAQFLFLAAITLTGLLFNASIASLREASSVSTALLLHLVTFNFLGLIAVQLGWIAFKKIGALGILLPVSALVLIQAAAVERAL